MGLSDYGIFDNAWIPILFMIFLGVAFEIFLVKTCEFFKKKLEVWETGSLCSQKDEDVFPKKMTFAIESWSISHTSSAERAETLSGSVISSPPSEENGDNTRERTFSSDECEYQGKHFCEYHSSSGGTNSSLSMFCSEVKKIFTESFHRKDPQSEYQTIQLSSNNLFSIMKTNKAKDTFPDALNFQRGFKFKRDKDLNVTPCPPVHLFLSSEQIRHVEENVSKKIPVSPKVISGRKADCLHPRYQESLIHYQHSNEVVIPAEAQDTSLDQSVMQKQMIHEARFTTKTQQFIHNQELVSSEPGFVQPLDFMRLPLSSRIQDSFQVQQVDHKDKSQHFIHIPRIVETEDSTKGKESDEHFSEAQYSVYLNDQNKSNHLVKGQNSVFQNAEFLFLHSNSFSEAMPQQKITPGQQPMASLESNQHYTYSSMSLSPTIKRQRNRRKIQDNETKLSLKVPSLKTKKISCSQVFPIIVYHTSENKIELRYKKKKIIHQKKMISNKALHLISVSEPITLHDKKFFLKNLVAVILDLIKCEHFLQGQNKLLDTDKINYLSSTDREGLGIIENKHITVPCSLFETKRERKESSEVSIRQIFDLNLPKPERLSEVSSESLQKDISFPQIESSRGMKIQDISSTANVGELKVGTSNAQRCFSKDRVQNAKNSVAIIPHFPGTNFLISLGSQKQEKNELEDLNVQVIAGSINIQKEKPLTANITEYVNPANSETLECDTTSNKKNRHQDERMSDNFHTMQATISEPFDMEICNELKANAGTLTIDCSHAAVKEGTLLDEKKIQEVKHIDKSPILRKPQEWDREEEEKIRETVGPLAGNFRVSKYVKQKDKCAQLEMGQIHSGNRKIQSKEEEVQSQIISTQRVWEISPCPLTNPLQADEVKQRIDKEEAAGPMHPPPENLPAGECVIEITECRVPFCGKPTKTLDSHVTGNKELKKSVCAADTGPFKARKISRQKNVLGVKHKIMKEKKSAFSLRLSITIRDTLNCRRKVGDSFKIIIKHMLHDVILASGLLNVHPQRSSIHNIKTNIKVTPQKTQAEKKNKNLDFLNKEKKGVYPLESQLCHSVKMVKQVLPETVAPAKRSFRVYSHPLKEIKMEKEMFPAISFTETIGDSVNSLRMDSFCVANTKNSTSTQTELQYCAGLELGPPTSGKLRVGDSLNQSRESNVPNCGNGRKEISCGFTQKTLSWPLNYCKPVLTHPKKKKDQTRFTNMSSVRLKNMNKKKSPASKAFNITYNKKNSKLDHKTKLKRIKQAKAFLLDCQNTLGLSIHRRLKRVFCHAQLKQGGLANKIHIDCVAESSAFYNREKKLQEEKQNPEVQAALHYGQYSYSWEDADQRKDILLDEPGPSPISLSQEQSDNSQGGKCQIDSLQSALEASLEMAPIQIDGLQKTTKTENGTNFPVVPPILSPEAKNFDGFTNMTDDNLESDANSEHKLDLYPVEKDSETSTGLQVTFLQTSDSVTGFFISRTKGERKALRSKKQTTVSQRRRTMREINRSVSQTVNFRYRKKLRHKETKGPQQRGNIADACLDIIHSKVYIMPKKKIRNSKPWTDKQRIKRLVHMQQMREKSPNERNVPCRGSADLSNSSIMKNYDEEGEEEPECFLISENSPSLIVNMYQEEDHDLVRSDNELSQLGRTITQVQPQTPTEVISYSTLGLIPHQFQLEKLEGSFSVYPLKFGEAKNNALSERESDLSDERLHKNQAVDSKKEAKELSLSYSNPNHSGKMKCDSTKMKGIYEEKKTAGEISSLTNVVLDINMSSKLETEKSTPSKETPCSIQKKPEILVYEGNVTSDDIKEIDLQDKEEKKNNDTLLKAFPQHSQHSVFYSHQSRDPNSHKLNNQRGRNMLFIVEQDILEQSQSADLTQRKCAMCTSSSKASPIKSKESKLDKVNIDRTKIDISANDPHVQKLNCCYRLEREGLKNDLQATITESLNLSTPNVQRLKRKSKGSTNKTLQGKKFSAGVTKKRRKTSASKLLSIPQFGYRNNLPPKTVKSQISELLIHPGVLSDSLNVIILKDPTAEKNKRLLTQELEATMLEPLPFSLPTSKERENFKLMDKRNEISNNSLTVKISQALITAECRTPKQSKCMVGSSLNTIFSPMPVSLNTCDRIKDRNTMWTMKFSQELHGQSVHEERDGCTHYTDKDTSSNDTKDVKGQGEEDPPVFQHFSFRAHNRKGPNFIQSGLQQINSATYPELERSLYNKQAQPVNVNILQSSMVGVRPPVLNTEESEFCSIPGDNTWNENPRRKCDYPIAEQKARTERELASLESLQGHSPASLGSKYESYTLEFSGKRHTSPKARQASRLLNISRHYTRVHRKQRFHNIKHELRKVECVEEALLYAIEDAESCPLKFITDKLLLGTGARAAFSTRIPQESIAEKKAKLQANLATAFLRPYNFFIPVLSDFKSQVNTVKLSENKITLNNRFSIVKEKKPSISKVIKTNEYFITNRKKKFKLRAKMKAIWLSENITDLLQNTTHFLLTNPKRNNTFKTEVGLGVSKFTLIQPTHGESPVEGIAEYDDSTDNGDSNSLKKSKLHAGQCWGEKQDLLMGSGPFYTKHLTVNTHLIKKPSLEQPEGILLRDCLPQRSQVYEANPEINVNIENKSMQVSFKDVLSNMEKSHSCSEVSKPTSNTSKHGINKAVQSLLKEKSLFYLTGIATSIARHLVASKEFKKQNDSTTIPDLSVHKDTPSQIREATVSQSLHGKHHAATNINKTRDFRTLGEIKADNGEVKTNMKSIYMCMPIQHIKTESSHNIWNMDKKSRKENCLDKAKVRRKEFGQLPFGADQKRQTDPFKSEVLSPNTVHHKDITLQKTAIYLIDQEGNAEVGEEFSQEVVLSSNTHTLQIERQKNEFKTGWKTKSKSFALPKKEEMPNILGPMWSSYASDTTYPETIRQEYKAKTSNVKNTVCGTQIKLKAKKMPVPLLLGHEDRSNKKELGHRLQHLNTSELRKNEENLALKANFDLGCFTSPDKRLASVKLGKDELEERKNILPQTILEKPLNQRQMSQSGYHANVSRKLEEHRKEAQDHQTFNDTRQQFTQQFWFKSEEIKEHHSCKLENLQRKMNSELTLQKDASGSLRIATSRSKGGTKVSIDPQDSLQQKCHLKQGTWRPGRVLQPVKEFPHFGMTSEPITKQGIKSSSPQEIGGLKVTDNPLDPKESLFIPGLMVQNLFTDPLLGSIPCHVPHQLHTEEPEENMKISDTILKNSTQQLKKISNMGYMSDTDYIPRSIEKLLLLIKEQAKRRKKGRGCKKNEISEDIKTTMKNPIPFLNYSQPRTQCINPTKNSRMFRQRDVTEPNRSVATLWRQQRMCVQGNSLDYVYTSEITSKVIHQNKRRTTFMESILYHKKIKMKVRRTTSGKLLNITGYRTHSYRKELRHSIKSQKELPKGKTAADLPWKGFCASDYIASQIKKLIEVNEGKDKSQKTYILPQLHLKKTLNETEILSVQPTDNNSISSTIRKSAQYTIKQKEHQVVLFGITPQNKDQLMTGQQVEEPKHLNFNAHLEKEAYYITFPETTETDYSRLEAQRPTSGTEFEFSTAQGVLNDSVKHAPLVPCRRGGPEKMSIPSSKGHYIYLMEPDAFQKKTSKVKELCEQENSSRVGSGVAAGPVRESLHLERINVAKEASMYYNIKNIPHLFELRKTNTELGPKAQAFLSTGLEDLHKTGTAQRGYVKSSCRPRMILNSVSCHKRAPLHLKPAFSTMRKNSGDRLVGAKMSLKGEEKTKSAGSPLKLNRKKVEMSKKMSGKQLTIFTQNKEKILNFFLSCILYQLQAENKQKQISAKAVIDPKIFNPVVEKAPKEVKILRNHSPSSGVNTHTNRGSVRQENACDTVPMSNTCLMGIQQITSPQVKKALKAVDNPDCHILSREKGEHNKIKEQNQDHLSFSRKNLAEHISCSQNYSYVQPHTRETLSKVGNVSSRTKGLDLSFKDQLSTVCECRQEQILPSAILEQTKEQNAVLSFKTLSKTIKCPSHLSFKRKQLFDRVQISKSVLNDSSSTPRVSKKELPHRASEKKQDECLPQLFLHCLSLCMQLLHENERQKGNIEYGVRKDTLFPERKALSSRKLALPHINSTEYTTSNKAELQCYKREKMIRIKYGKDKAGPVVIKACDPIPLPHFKLDKEKIDVFISNNVRQEKHKSQGNNGIKGMEMKGTIDSNNTLKAEELLLSYPSRRKKLILLFDSTKKQEELSKSDIRLMKSFISLPPLLHANLNSRTKVAKDKSRLLESYLSPLKLLLALKGRKVPFSKTFSRDNLCKLTKLKYLSQRKEFRNKILDLKDIIGLLRIVQKGKKSPLKCLLQGKELWWNNKVEKVTQGNEKNLSVVQNKAWGSIPSSPYLDPKKMGTYLQGTTKFFLRSAALSKLPAATEVYQEPTDGISCRIKKAKDVSLKYRLQIAPKEAMYSRSLTLRQKLSSTSQELQFSVEEKAKKIQEDRQTMNWDKPPIYYLPYSEVDKRINGEEAMQIRTKSSTHHPKLLSPSDTGKIIHTKSNFKPILNTVKDSMEYGLQKEESTKTEENMHLKEKTSVSRKIQLDITEPGQELQNIKNELNVVETSTWISSSCLKSDTRIEKADGMTEVILHTLPELPLQKPSTTLSEMRNEWVKGRSTSDTQKEDHMPQETGHSVKTFCEKLTVHIKDRDCKGNKARAQDLLSSPKEQGKINPPNEEQERVDGKDKNQENYNNDGEDQKEMDLHYTKQGKHSQDSKEQVKMDGEVREQGESGRGDQEQEEEQKTWNHKCDTQGQVDPNSIEPKKGDKDGKSKEKVAPEYPPFTSSYELDIRTEDMQRTIKSANSQLQHQQSLETGKSEHTESTEDDDKSNIKVGRQCESWISRGKTVHTKDVKHPKDTNPNKNQLPLSHEPSTNGHFSSNTVDEQTNVSENLGHVQERKCELGKGLTTTSLPHSTLELEIKVKEETWVETGSFSQHSQSMESPDSEKLNYATSSLNDISNFKRSKNVSYGEENGVNTLERSIMHPKARHANINESPLSYVSQIKRLKLEEQSKKQESSKRKVILLRKTHSVITSSEVSKLDKSEDVETEVMHSHVPYPMPQGSLPVGQVASTKAIVNHSKKRKLYPPWEGEEIQTSASLPTGQEAATKKISKCAKKRKQYQTQEEETSILDSSTHSSVFVLKAKTAAFHVSSVNETSIPRKRKTLWSSSKEKIGQKQTNSRVSNVFAAKNDTPMPSVLHHGLSPLQNEFLMTPFTGKFTHTASNEGTALSNVIIKANQQKLYDKAKVSVTENNTKDRITWRTRISPSKHLNETSPPFNTEGIWNIKYQRKEDEQDKSEPIMAIVKEAASLPSPSFLKADNRVSEEKDILSKPQISFLPLKIQNLSDSEKRPCVESSGYVLNNRKEPKQEKEKNRLRKDVKDKKIPKSIDQKGNKLPLSHTLSIKELQRETQQEKPVDLASTTVELPISQLQLEKFSGAQIADREVYSEIELLKGHMPQKEKEDKKEHVGVLYVKDMYLKTKKSPTSPVQNLSDCQWKTREQGENVEGNGREPGGTLMKKLTKASTSISSQHSFTADTGIKEECTLLLTRSSVSTGYFQKSSDSEGSSYTQPITGNISISLQNEKQHMSERKEEAGMQIAKIIKTHEYQETTVQEHKDERNLVLAKSSPLLHQPKLYENIEFNGTKLRLRYCALQKPRSKEETVPREDIVGDTSKDVKKQHLFQREETYRKERDRRGTDITLKSRKSPLSQKLHRTELHMHINTPKTEEQDNKSEPRVLRKMSISKYFPTNITVCRGVQVGEQRLENKLSSPISQMIPTLSDAEDAANKETTCSHISKGKQYTKEMEKIVDLASGVHYKKTKVPSISQILNTKEFVLNMKILEKKMHKDKGELTVVAKRSFLSVPSPSPRCPQDKTQTGTASVREHSYPQDGLPEPADAQETASRESAELNSIGIVKTTEFNMLHKQVMLQKSKSVISTHGISESAPADYKIDLTRVGTIKRENMLGMSVKEQKDQPEKCGKEASTKIGNWKKENEIKDSLRHKKRPKFSVLSPKKSFKKALITRNTLVCSKGSVTKREQETCSCKSDKLPKERQSNATISKLLIPEKTSPEKLRDAHSGKSQNKEEPNVNIEEQAMPHSKSGQQIKPKSFPLLNVPIHSKNQRMPLQTDVNKKTTVNIRPQIQSGLYRSTLEFNATRREGDSPSIVLEQKQYYLALHQKSHDSLLKSEHLEDRDEMNTVSDINQRKLEIENNCTVSQKEGKVKADRSRGLDLEEVKRETQKSCTVSLENKARKNSSSTTSHALPEESEIKTQVVISRENYLSQEQLTEELELSTVTQNLQGQKLLHTNILNSVYPYIPVCLKRQKSKFKVTNLKRIPKHTISKILGIIGCGSPINKRKLEYGFSKPKTMVPGSKDISGITSRSLCVSMTSPLHAEGTVESKTNPGREKRVCLYKFQEKLPDARDSKDILTTVKEPNCPIPLLQDSQPFVANDEEMWKFPDGEPEVNLECEIDKNLCLQAKVGVVAGSEDLNIIHKLDMNTTEQEENQKDTVTSPECSFEDKNDTIETLSRTLSSNVPPPGLHLLPRTPLFDKMRKYSLLSKQGEAAPGTVSVTLEDEKKENKTHIEFLSPIYEAFKCIFENKIENQVLSYKLGEMRAYKPNNAKVLSLLDSPGTSPKTDAILLHTPLLKELNPELKNKLSMHLISKATDTKLNQMPEMVNISLQKRNSHHQRSILEDYNYRIYLKHIKMNTIYDNLKNNYQSDFPPLSCVNTTAMSVSSSSKVMTEIKDMRKQENETSLETWSNLPLSHILHKFSEKERNNLLKHFCIKTLEIQTSDLPRIAAQSYAIAEAQNKPKALFKCIHSATKGPKQINRVLILFDEKSFCEIDRDLQCKYLRSIPRPSATLVSKPNVLPLHTSKLTMGSGSESVKATDSVESSTLSFDKELLQHISFQSKNPQESSLLVREFQKPTNVSAFHPGLQGMEQNDMVIPSNLKLQMTDNSEDKQCHLWFQESKHSVLGTQQNAADLASSHSSWISDEWTNDVPLNMETSTDLAKCSGPEDSDSDECVFIETNFHLPQNSQKFLCEVPEGIPLAGSHKVDKASFLKTFHCEDPNEHHAGTHRKHTSPVAQPCYQSRNSRKHRSNSKMQTPDWLSHSSSNTVEIESTSSSLTVSEVKNWTTTMWRRASYSITSSATESNIQVDIAKTHGKPYMYSQGKERGKGKSDLWRKFSVRQSSNYIQPHSQEKHTRRKRRYHYESKEPNPQTNQMPEPHALRQNTKFYSERRENQPFFYACIPADSMDIIPQTIRWMIPHKFLQKRNFQVPRVAKISKS